ncbi:hypothetical protein RchiOBHm_Chr7g0232141 [Rosa chinensis]|uniref:Uncharacterized protein n=1 Tax=Rosa chinensis TaxID=74649 RepID=A0A2P6PFV1_ROSCH|nr:neurofilament medium polypeptide [Rosa chinensis]XP_024169412.1 neurofilament medium polypeptide [Rosa chinensis]XP_040366051.1 neurofilament medium polypeptide [Rosa chinensis]PRQ20806.1 hypothetical protein RchiOBHm_Chr7g0232141 [Rosa chinensis]
MLKQSPSRNQRVKGFKVKHAVQISLLLAICIWLVYQLNHSHGKKALEVSSAEKISGEVQNEHGVLELGRRGLRPHVEETSMDVGRHREKEEESEEEADETKAEESEEEGRGGEDEVDGHDQEKSEEESEGVEDLIDEDDTEREEESEEQESEEQGNDLEDQVQNRDTRYSQDAREEQYKGDDASSAVKQNIRTISNQIEIGSLRRVKEEEVDTAENIDLEKDNKATGETKGNQFGSVKIDGQTDAGSSTTTSEKPKRSTGSLYGTEMLLKLYYDSI